MNIIDEIKKEVIKRSNDFYNKTKGTNDEYDLYNSHVKYVFSYVDKLCSNKNVDKEVLELCALLHDISMTDIKLDRSKHNEYGAKMAEELLQKYNYPQEKIELIKKCIYNHSNKRKDYRTTLEEHILVDADSLSHFDSILLLYSLANNNMGLNEKDSVNFVKEKLTKDYYEVSEDVRCIIKDKYFEIMESNSYKDLINCKKYELKELDNSNIDELYEMYQDIPDGENEQINKAYGLSKKDFKEFINNEIKRKYNEVTKDDTPTITYILYVDNKPVGYICLRTKIDENWLKWSGNFYYKVRQKERNKGYATKMLSLALDKFKELGFTKVYGQSSKGNIASSKVIENNNGIFLKDENGTKYYKILIDNKVYFKVPKKEELTYRKQLMLDSKTMNYNSGYNVDIEGYNYDNGTINWPDSKYDIWYKKWMENTPIRYYAYICDFKSKKEVGEIYFYYDDEEKLYNMGILIKDENRGKKYSLDALNILLVIAFERYNISCLSDIIPDVRKGAVNTFIKAGFKVTDKQIINMKFNKEEVAHQLLITKDEYKERNKNNE